MNLYFIALRYWHATYKCTSTLILDLLLLWPRGYKGLGSRRGEIGPAIEMQTDLKYVYMVYFIEKNRNFICLVLKLWKLWVIKDKVPL